MARKKKPKRGESGPAWLITFSDLMTLLLTFFVLLLSMAVIDERAKLEVLGSVTKTFGVGERVFNPRAPKDKPSIREPGVMDLEQEDLAPMRDMLFDDIEKDLNFQENKYVQIFSINDQVLFRPGGTELTPEGTRLLDRILPYLQRIDYPLLVAGHTAVERDESRGGYTVVRQPGVVDSTWLVSFRRAMAVYRFLVGRSIEPSRLSLEAFGQFHPRYSNNTPEGRQKNRRVDLVLDKRNREWIRKMEDLREPEPVKVDHTVKGFKFDLTMPGSAAPRKEALMARRKKKSGGDEAPAWLITFSDLMTLLLTFFVLLLSMATMDTTVITRISSYPKSLSLIDFSGAGRVPERIQLLTKLLKDPKRVLDKKNRIKDLLFPLDVLPKEISTSDLDKNLKILAHPEGVVIVLTGGLLFPQGSAVLDEKGKKLLAVLTPVVHAVNADVNISGYTDDVPARGISNDDLSLLRALAILEHFLQAQLRPDRFSVSGYGADRPLFPNDTDEHRAQNRRVEILLKTAPRIGSYQ